MQPIVRKHKQGSARAAAGWVGGRVYPTWGGLGAKAVLVPRAVGQHEHALRSQDPGKVHGEPGEPRRGCLEDLPLSDVGSHLGGFPAVNHA